MAEALGEELAETVQLQFKSTWIATVAKMRAHAHGRWRRQQLQPSWETVRTVSTPMNNVRQQIPVKKCAMCRLPDTTRLE